MSEELNQNEQSTEAQNKGQIVQEKGLGYTLTVDREDLFKAARGLKEAGLDLLLFVTGTDYPDSIKLTYRVCATSPKKNYTTVMIKTEVPKSDPVVDSLVPLWSSANWHERETYDLLGVEFKGHPDLRRIFMPEDWVGYPLRKDYSDGHMIKFEDATKKEKPAKEGPAKEKPVVKKKQEEAEKDE